jgi:hypothetical protein
VVIVTAPELARRLRVDPKALRGWLRAQARASHPILSDHRHYQRWEFTGEEADTLANEYENRSGAKGRPSSKGRSPRPRLTPIRETAESRPSIGWDTRFVKSFRGHGFQGFVRLGEAVADRSAFLAQHSDFSSPGVYAVFTRRDWSPRWRTEVSLPNVINPWSAERLSERWIKDVELAYIGCAGATPTSRSLHKRLRDLLKHGAGMLSANGPHKGGERLWQCVGWEDFSLAWAATGPYPEPHELEVAIGERFVALAGALPFANVRL